MRRRIYGSVLLLTTLTLSLLVGDVLVLGQDPPTTPPTQTPQTQTPRTTATASPTEQTDLSGTYAGTFNCDALGLSGDTTLTITGNQFTTADGKTGRIVASTTRGYTAVALQIGDTGPATAATTGAAATMAGGTAATPTTVSMRARKSGDRLTLTSVPGATMQCSFMPARNVARGRRSRQRTPAATGTDVANPGATPTTTPAQPMPDPSQTPSPAPSPSPTGSPTPEPSPSPSPSPTPTGSPTPEPSPTASPSPTPSPSPSPSPNRNQRPRG
ncbi:MAG: hypothetical protein LC794_05765 [Acidobacteria bacterium]|nr:hypothetical protein [Acidobacteriota bacterium]